jgi:MFS family permease
MAASEAAAEAGLPPQLPGSDLSHMVRALRHRDFRLFWGGNFLSNIGTWMQNVAMGWLVLQLAPSNAALWLGVVGFASSVPSLFLSLVGGVIADRINRRKLVFLTQSAMMIIAFVLWAITAMHRMNLTLLVVLSFATGVAMALNVPSYQAMVPQLVPREDLANAIALNAAQFNMSRVIGPMLGGLAMAWIGVQGNFFLNGLSFLAVLAALAMIHSFPQPDKDRGTVHDELRQGLSYAYHHAEIFTLLLIITMMSILVIPYMSFIPLFAKQILHLNERGYGLLMAANGIGAVLAAVTMAHPGHGKNRGRVLFQSGLASCISVVLFALSHNRWWSGLLMVVMGYSLILMAATTNVMMQHLSDDKLRGRVMSLFAMAFLGVTPLGSLLAGWLAGRFTAPLTIATMSTLAAVLLVTIYQRSPKHEGW